MADEPVRPTEEEIARVAAWQEAEHRRKVAKMLDDEKRFHAENSARISGYFVGKTIMSVKADVGTERNSDDLDRLRLTFSDGSSVSIGLDRWGDPPSIELSWKAGS